MRALPLIATTRRLTIRLVTLDDAEFMLELLNDPGWLASIGDRNVRTLEDARRDIAEKTLASYERHGFGFYLVERKDDGVPLGICGLAKRQYLEDVDLGFALLERHAGRGYAYEAAEAVVGYATTTLNLKRLVGITRAANLSSAKLLAKLGFVLERELRSDDTGLELKLFGRNAQGKGRADF
jgi:RimJ/RimL family protein N-acetyltransferase